MIRRYTLFYAALYAAITVVLFIIQTVLDLEGGTSVAATMAILTAVFIGQTFAKEQQRRASRKELHLMLATFTCVATAVSFLQVMILLWTMAPLDRDFLLEDISPGIMLVFVVIGLVLHYGLTWLGFTLGCRRVLKRQAKLRDAN
ncbi:ABZJ_00895 family protein [Hydrocarboniclastica marina]|uniref:ABZJ_00895 family protein n=1 Tax=Hydrocarboniclastica marina TaxID=2259620 RepID=UPI0010A9050F|nr:ABZJ_00895 family protein [Hydrocarboniclastica marina]